MFLDVLILKSGAGQIISFIVVKHQRKIANIYCSLSLLAVEELGI